MLDHSSDPEEFDPVGYLYLNFDVLRATGGDLSAATDHWKRHGRLEGRTRPGQSPFRSRRTSGADVLGRPFGVNAFAPLSALSGLGTAARGMIRALGRCDIPLELWNYDLSKGYPRLAEADRARAPRYRINLIFVNADMVEPLWRILPAGYLDGAYNIGVWQWELAAFRPDWFPCFGAFDEIWTNSEFQRTAIGASAPIPVVNIKLPVAPVQPPDRLARADFGLPPSTFVFLCAFDVGSTSDRKNPFAAIQAFRAAFSDRDDVTLVLKFHSAHHEKAFVQHLNREIRGRHNVIVLAQTLTYAQMADLRQVCDCLVSPHRSEGFGLNIAEFMALGRPVIATDYSGSRDFLDSETGFPVSYDLVEVQRTAGPYWQGNVWAEPRVSSLIEQMQTVFGNVEERIRRGRNAAARIASNHSYDAVASSMIERFKAVGLDGPPIPFLFWIGTSPTRAIIQPTVAGDGQNRCATANVLLSIIMPVFNVPGELLARSITSVLEQTYVLWELCICNDGSTRPDTLSTLERFRGLTPKIKIRDLPTNVGISSASNAAVELASGSFVVLLDNDDELTVDALEAVADALLRDPSLDCLYSDEDKIDLEGERIDHFMKPDWSPEHLESVMYVLHMLVIRKRLFLEVGTFRAEYDGAQDYDLMLRCSRATDRIHHIPRVLYHWRAIPGSAAEIVDAKPYALEAGLRAISDHGRKKYGDGLVVEDGLTPGTFRLRRPIAAGLRVTLLILTNNASAILPGRGLVSFVENFVGSIVRMTSYLNYEVVVVDNRSLLPDQIERLRGLGARIEQFEIKTDDFNFSAKANFAVSRARTEHVVLLNDDMEVIRPDWLHALLELSQDLEVGAVGARLLHFDGTLQHAGMVLGVNKSAAHVYHTYPGEMVGYNAFTHVIRNYSVVTAACLAMRRSVLASVGGFDEDFAIDFNDVDLCLRIREAGYRVVYTPFAELYHFEQASLPRTVQNEAERRLFNDRWHELIENDPFYNPNLSRDRIDFALREPNT